jgi:hypothetical protein
MRRPVSLDGDPRPNKSSVPVAAEAAGSPRTSALFRGPLPLKVSWSFALTGTAIAVFAISWISYGFRRTPSDIDIIVGASAAILTTLVCGLSYLVLRYQSSMPEAAARLAVAEHIGTATQSLGVRSAPGRLGALYILERLGIESGDSAASVLNSILDFIRSETDTRRAPGPRKESALPGQERLLPNDVQTAIDVIGRLRILGRIPLSLKIDLSWCDLSGARLRGWDLSGIDLHRAILDDADLSHTNFDNANLPYCSFRRARVVGSSFRWAVLFSADFTSALAVDCDFSDAMMVKATLHAVEMHNCSFRSSMLQNAIIESARLQNADFSEAQATGAKVENSEIEGNQVDVVLAGGNIITPDLSE